MERCPSSVPAARVARGRRKKLVLLIYVEKGNNALQLETQCAWAVPDKFTDGMLGQSTNYRCYEDGTNCGSK